MRNVTLRPFETCHVHAITDVKGHEQRVNVAIDPPTNCIPEQLLLYLGTAI